jgi:hypothetical protein
MKRVIAGILLSVAMAAVPAVAYDGDRASHRDIRHDRAQVTHDRRELRRDRRNGNYAGARHERRQLRREHRDIARDRRQLR